MSTLHTLHLASKDALSRALAAVQPDDAMLLREDAVMLLRTEQLTNTTLTACYALQADVEARGLQTRLPSSIQLITDADFVALTLQHARVIAWR